MRKLITVAAAIALALAASSPAFAAGKKTGFAEEQTSTQGSGGQKNTSANPNNQGQTVEETSGPSGQVKKGNTTCNNCTTVIIDKPGRNR